MAWVFDFIVTVVLVAFLVNSWFRALVLVGIPAVIAAVLIHVLT